MRTRAQLEREIGAYRAHKAGYEQALAQATNQNDRNALHYACGQAMGIINDNEAALARIAECEQARKARER